LVLIHKHEKKDFKIQVDQNKNKLLLIYNNKVIGYCWFNIYDNNNIKYPNKKVFELHSFNIYEYFRNKKFGTYFMNEIIKYVKNLNYDIISLQVMKNNEPALKLYKKFGFDLFKEYTYWLEYALYLK
jgi:ribosomal protein S18 acetylase RimI-like enzyme